MPPSQTLTLETLGRLYLDRYMHIHRKASVKEEQYRINRLYPNLPTNELR